MPSPVIFFGFCEKIESDKIMRQMDKVNNRIVFSNGI